MSYKIGYEENGEGEGEITSIVYPTGARVDYTYETPDSNGPRVHTRKVTVGSQVATWTYDYSFGSPSSQRPTFLTVTDPESNQIKYTCTPLGNKLTTQTFVAGAPPACWMTEADYYDANGTLVKKVATGYSTTGSPLPTSVVTTWVASNQVSEVDTAYDSQTITVGKANDIYTAPFSWGNPTDVYEYGYGTGAKGALLRHTHHDYLHLPSSDPNISNPNWQKYQAVNIADKPTSTIVYDGSGNVVSRRYYSYDAGTLTSTNGAAPGHNYSGFGPSNTIRGNLTKDSRWIDAAGTHKSETSYAYDDLGNRLSEIDPNGYTTTFSYAGPYADADCIPSGTSTYAFPTLITDPLGHRTSHTYYSCTGQTASTADENDIVAKRAGTTYSYDKMNRVSTITYPDGGQTTKSYTDSLPYEATTTTAINGSTNHVVTTEFDGLGRVSETQETTPAGTVYVDTGYDLLGRVSSVSNPHWSTPSPTTDGSTGYLYDLFGRKVIEKKPDGSSAQWCYDGVASPNGESNCLPRAGSLSTGTWVDYSDETQRHWQHVSDGLGRLTATFEPDASNKPTIESDYQYDTLDNLLRIDQWGGTSGAAGERIRTFGYDRLSRLICAANPEIGSGTCPAADGGAYVSGTTRYTYDANGNVFTKQFPAPNAATTSTSTTTITNGYDKVNRLLTSTHSDGTPMEQFSYDTSSIANSNPVGHLTFENLVDPNSNILAQRTYQIFDTMGRLKQETQCSLPTCPGTLNTVAYTYDLAGNLITSTNGVASQPITLTYGYDSAEQLKTVTSSWSDAQHPTTLFQPPASATGLQQYDPFGHVQHANLAINSQTQLPGITLARTYDKRGRIVSETDTSSSTTLYSYTISTPSPNSTTGYAGNGNVVAFNDSVAGQWNLGYDNLNRLTSATGVSGSYSGQPIAGQSLTWTYDAFGNRAAQSTPGSLFPTSWAHFTTNDNRMAGTNQITGGVVYDAAGNVKKDGVNVYAMDAESRPCAFTDASGHGWTNVYDAGGSRVAKGTVTNGAACFTIGNGFALTETTVLGRGGEQLSTLDGSGNWQRSNVYANGELLATYEGPTIYFALNDWLGTKRVEATPDGKPAATFDSLPFGDGLVQTGGPDASAHHFTGKLHDSESTLDYFGARFYASGSGRFLSPDWSEKPEEVPYADLANPQTLNLYGYAGNNPLSRVDPDGHDPISGSCCVPYGSWLPGNPQNPDLSSFNEFVQTSMAGGSRSTSGAALLQSAVAQQQTTAQTQQQIADAARGQLGSTDYAKSAPPCGQWKCSKFVGAILNAVGIGVHQGYPSDPNLPPVAGDWANPKVAIKNWTMLPVGATPQAGDVAAYRENYSDATGHAGIVYQVNDRGAYVIAAGEKHVYGTYSFGDGTGATVRYRRFTPDGGSQ